MNMTENDCLYRQRGAIYADLNLEQSLYNYPDFIAHLFQSNTRNTQLTLRRQSLVKTVGYVKSWQGREV